MDARWWNLMAHRGPENCPFCAPILQLSNRVRGDEAPSGLVLPPTWKQMDRHPHIHCGTWVPGGSGDKVVFCDRCLTIWHVVFAGSSEPPQISMIDPDVHVLLDERARVEQVWPVLFTEDEFVRELLLGFLGGAEFDLSATAQALVASMRAVDLTLPQAERLLQCFCSLLRGYHRPARAQESVAVSDLQPLLDLADRQDLYRADPEGAPYAKYRIRDLLDEIAALAASRNTRGATEVLVTDPVFRERLLEVTGKEYRRGHALAEMLEAVALLQRALAANAPAEDRIRRDDCLRRLSEALVEIEEILWETQDVPQAADLRKVARVAAQLRSLVGRASWKGEELAAVERDYRDYLQRLLNSRQVPAECLSEVSAALGYHDTPESLDEWMMPEPPMAAEAVAAGEEAGPGIDQGAGPRAGATLRFLRVLLLGAGTVGVVFAVGWLAGVLMVPSRGWQPYTLLAAGLTLILAGGLRLLRIGGTSRPDRAAGPPAARKRA